MLNFTVINNIKVIHIPHPSQLVTFGIGTLNGSNFENSPYAGISHFAEHLYFKGTTTRTWKDINYIFAKNGANHNAYTSNTEVFYHATCPTYNMFNIVELMLDMFFNSTYPVDEIEKERNVITEEKKMTIDEPYNYFYNQIGDNLFCWEKGHDTIGTFETIANIKQNHIFEYLKTSISYENLIFVCCGDIDFVDLCKCIEKNIPSQHDFLKKTKRNIVTDEFWRNKPLNSKNYLKIVKDNLKQAYMGRVFRGLSLFDLKAPEISVFLRALGGGSYSLLFERIREELGLCYSIYLTHITMAFPDHISYCVGGETSKEHIGLFIEETENIFKKVIKDGISNDLFECAKNSLISVLMSVSETTMSTTSFMIERLLFDNHKKIEDRIKDIKNVTLNDCNSVSEAILNSDYNWAVMTDGE